MLGLPSAGAKKEGEAATPRRPRFFYGWVIVAVCFLAEATAFGAGSASLAVFLQPMSSDLGWTRTTLTFALTVQQLGNIVVAPIAGRLIDRRGPRLIMIFGAIVAGLGFMAISLIQAPWQFYILYGVAGAMGLQELGNLVTGTTISKWFIRMRGRALAFSGLGLNTGAVVFGPIIAVLIAELGWRSAWVVLGILVMALMLPPAALLLRRSPEDMGLQPDGDERRDDRSQRSSPAVRPRVEEPRFSVREALSTRTTWLIVLSTSMVGLALGTLNHHQVAYFIDSGLSLERASFFFAMGHLFTLPGKVMWGFMSERIPVRYCMAGNDLARAISILILLMFATGDARLWGYAVFTGLGQGVAFLNAKIWADYYGRAFVGSIRGVLTPIQVVSGLGGPLLAALIYDRTESYTISFAICTAALVVATISIWLARPPRPVASIPAPVS
jgi:sugar phosphate permease